MFFVNLDRESKKHFYDDDDDDDRIFVVVVVVLCYLKGSVVAWPCSLCRVAACQCDVFDTVESHIQEDCTSKFSVIFIFYFGNA